MNFNITRDFVKNSPKVLLTGFGPFGKIENNPSSELVRSLQSKLQEKSILSKILCLPVSYARAPKEIDNVLNYENFNLVLGFGLHRGSDFRFETRADPEIKSKTLDVDNLDGNSYSPLLNTILTSNIDINIHAKWLNQDNKLFRISDNASSYVCEAVYHHLLCRTLNNETLCGFIHIPKFEFIPLELQQKIILDLILRILATYTFSEK